MELLGKADNILFNQLYSLAENCADRYYSKVIKTLVVLIKRQFADRQTLLVNTAHALKFLEEYGDRQLQLWDVLTRYHNLPDHFEDLKTKLQTDLNYLKQATSKNIENIQKSLAVQQTYSTSLCTNINSIYTKLAQLESQVQQHCMYPHCQADFIQIDAPDYDPDIDGENQPQPHNKRVTISIQGTATPSNPSHV